MRLGGLGNYPYLFVKTDLINILNAFNDLGFIFGPTFNAFYFGMIFVADDNYMITLFV